MLRDKTLRPMIFSAALALISMQAQAQSTTVAPPAAPQTQVPSATAPAITTPAPSTATPARPSTGTRTSNRQTLQQRFDAANTTKDGHLTKEQASAAKWTYVNRNFDAMDKSHQGYLTVEDIRAYAAARRAERQATTPKNG